jgi:hypothetical protein
MAVASAGRRFISLSDFIMCLKNKKTQQKSRFSHPPQRYNIPPKHILDILPECWHHHRRAAVGRAEWSRAAEIRPISPQALYNGPVAFLLFFLFEERAPHRRLKYLILYSPGTIRGCMMHAIAEFRPSAVQSKLFRVVFLSLKERKRTASQ